MEQVHTYKQLRAALNARPAALVYVMSPDCAVCHADAPRIQQIAQTCGIPALLVDSAEAPEAAGQLNVFTTPAVLLFRNGREFHRQARFIDFLELEKRVDQLAGSDDQLTSAQDEGGAAL